jgi:threonine/homoserine/homoserine lactone efflux protein
MPWLLVMFPLVYSPGPANTMFASNGAKFGFRQSLPFMAGINVSFTAQSLLAGFGLSGLLVRYPMLFTMLRYGGIAYIAYLGWTFLKAGSAKSKEQPQCLTFVDGLVLTFINPKAWMMQAIMFSQFLAQGNDWVLSVYKLTAWLTMLNISGHIAWILFGSVLISRATAWFSPQAQNNIYAAMLFGSVYFLV